MWYNFILLLESKDVSKDTLDAWERTWSSSARSQLVDRKREKGASNGYLEQQVTLSIMCRVSSICKAHTHR